jgi:hypothetical protein
VIKGLDTAAAVALAAGPVGLRSEVGSHGLDTSTGSRQPVGKFAVSEHVDTLGPGRGRAKLFSGRAC